MNKFLALFPVFPQIIAVCLGGCPIPNVGGRCPDSNPIYFFKVCDICSRIQILGMNSYIIESRKIVPDTVLIWICWLCNLSRLNSNLYIREQIETYFQCCGYKVCSNIANFVETLKYALFVTIASYVKVFWSKWNTWKMSKFWYG